MRLSQREKLLLMILGAVAFLALSYYFIFKPQMERIVGLAIEDAKIRLEAQQVKNELILGKQLDSEMDTLGKLLGEKTKRFYPAILQDRLTILLDGVIRKTQIKVAGITFGQPAVAPIAGAAPQAQAPAAAAVASPFKLLTEQYKNPTAVADLQALLQKAATAAGNPQGSNPQEQANPQGAQQGNAVQGVGCPLESMPVTLQISGTYDQVMSFVKEIEGLHRSILFRNVTLATDPQGLLTGSLEMDIYAMPKLTEQDEDYLNWTLTRPYGKTNPFVK